MRREIPIKIPVGNDVVRARLKALQAGAQRTEAGNFINVDRLAYAFDLGRTECGKREVPFAEFLD